jgi:hypothetical protein
LKQPKKLKNSRNIADTYIHFCCALEKDTVRKFHSIDTGNGFDPVQIEIGDFFRIKREASYLLRVELEAGLNAREVGRQRPTSRRTNSIGRPWANWPKASVLLPVARR